MAELKTGTDLIPAASQEGDLVKATIRGEINLHNSPKLRKALLEVLLATNPRRLVLDLSLVPYMDSSALAVLVETLQRMRKNKGRIFLLRPQQRVRGLLEIARLDTIFSVINDEQEANVK